jgi:WD40 repeat protein
MSGKLQYIYPPAPITERGKPASIGGDPKNKKKIIYTVGRAVVIRDLHNPLDCWIYQEHKYETTCARLAPSGFYVASADKSARVLVWDCVGADKVIKLDKQSIGIISDIAWTDDSKRVAVGGSGREKMGECFLFDSGASVGEISGHSAPVTSIDIKQTRPYRLATGSEDFKMNWFEGPPFKYKASNVQHTRYINAVRFSPDGNKVVTVGSDKKGFLYDGKEGKPLGELNNAGAHNGSIFGVSWSPDSKKLLTASGDKTCKIWDADGNLLQTFSFFGNDVSAQQVACLWQGDDLVSVSLQGTITLLDPNDTERPRRTQLGHNKLITSVAYDVSSNKIYTTDPSAYTIEWDASSGHTNGFTGSPHTSAISQIKVIGDSLVSISIDDTVKITPLSTRVFGEGIDIGSQPNGVDGRDNIIVISAHDSIIVLESGNIVNKFPVKFEPISIAISPDRTEVAVGAKNNQLIHVFSLDGGKLKEKYTIEGHRGDVSALAYSHCGRYLASGDTNREVKVFESQKSLVEGWVYHTSKIMSVAWSPDSLHVASGSVDSAVLVWTPSDPNKRIHLKLAHAGGVRGVVFSNNTTLLSVGEDCCLKSWSLSY